MTDPVTNHTSQTNVGPGPEKKDIHICQLCKKRDDDIAKTAGIENVIIVLTCFLVVCLFAMLLLIWVVFY